MMAAVDGLVPFVGGVACPEREEGGETLEGFGDVVWHGEVDVAVWSIAPVERHAQEFGACAVDCGCVKAVKGGEEVVEIGGGGVLNTEVIDDEGKLDGVGFVAPQGGGAGDRVVAVRGEVLDEPVLGDAAGLFETRDTLSDLDVHEAVVFNAGEIVFGNNLSRDERDGDSHIFVGGEGGAVVELVDVDGAEAGGGGADCAVEEAFDGGDRSAGGRCVTVVLEAITTRGDAYTILFLFEWSDGSDETGVGHFAVFGDSTAGDEKDGVGAGDVATDPLGEEA